MTIERPLTAEEEDENQH